MNKINIRGVDHFYQFTSTHGDNSIEPVLVFIHGWLLSHRYWTPLIEQLKNKYSCLSYDLKGFGASQITSSQQDSSSFSLKSYAHDLQELLAKLEIKKAWLLGHSLGGSIALWGADICSDVVEGVICVNAGGGIYLKEEFERFRKAGENMVKFRPSWFQYLPFFDRLFARMMVQQPLEVHWGKYRLQDFIGANKEAAIGSLLESTTETEVHYLPQIVARLSQPVYFIAGKQDQIMEPQYVKHLASFHKLFQNNHNNVYEIDQCGHFAMLEQTNLVTQFTLKVIKQHQNNFCQDKMLR